MANRIILLCLLISYLTVCYIECKGDKRGSRNGAVFGHLLSTSGKTHFPKSATSRMLRSTSGSNNYPSSGSGILESSSNSQDSLSSIPRLYESSRPGISGSYASFHDSMSAISKLLASNSDSDNNPSPGSGLSESSSSSRDRLSSISKYLDSESSPSDSSWSSNRYHSGGSSVSGSVYDSSLSKLMKELNSDLHSDYSPDTDLWPFGIGVRSEASSSSKNLLSMRNLSTSSESSVLPDVTKMSLPTYPISSQDLIDGSSSVTEHPSTSKEFQSYPEPSDRVSAHGHVKPSSGISDSGSQPSYGTNNNYSYKPHDSIDTFKTSNSRPNYNNIPSYYTAPQYAYVHKYRNSDSCFRDLLTGLTLYNLNRLHYHRSSHFYYDDYYYENHLSSRNPFGVANGPTENATCLLKVKENRKIEGLKVPCEIVSTFTEDSNKLGLSTDTLLKTVCTTNSTMVNSTLPVNGLSFNSGTTANATVVNVTVCTKKSNIFDPLTVKGPPVDVKNMECDVEIHTKQNLFRNNIDCNTLLSYANIPEPKKDTGMLPPRDKLKTWLSKPPWWASMFIAV